MIYILANICLSKGFRSEGSEICRWSIPWELCS